MPTKTIPKRQSNLIKKEQALQKAFENYLVAQGVKRGVLQSKAQRFGVLNQLGATAWGTYQNRS